MKTLLIRYFSGVALLGSLLWLFYAQGYRIITTPSVPPGIWKIELIHGPIRRGQFVWLCPPDTSFFQVAKQQGYIPEGDCPGGYMHLMKPIAAIEGDRVKMTIRGIAVNGQWISNSQVMDLKKKGFPMQNTLLGEFRVSARWVWLISPYHNQSFDSRYFGAISVESIEKIGHPVWTFVF